MLVLLIAELLPDCSKKSIRTCSITCTLVKILKLQFFATTVNSLLDNHLPLRLIKANSNDKTWITPEIKDPISKRQDACAAGKSENFGFYRNKISAVCKKSRSAYYHSNISDVQQCKSRKWWSTLSSIAGLSTPKNISTLMHDNLPFSDAALAHLFNDIFFEVGSSLPRLSWTPLPREVSTYASHLNRRQGSRYIFLLWVLGLHDLVGFESPDVLKGSHKTGSMRASFYICVPGTHYKFKNAFFGKHFA